MFMGKKAIGIVGTGFGTIELLRYLIGHPKVYIAKVFGRGDVGKRFDEIWSGLQGQANLVGEQKVEEWKGPESAEGLDLIFLALPSEECEKYTKDIPAQVRIIDLGAHRFEKGWEYGAADIRGFAEKLKGAKRIANPGCYPTAALLGLAPLILPGNLLMEALENPIVIIGLSGTSGAGNKPKNTERFLHARMAGNACAYGTMGYLDRPNDRGHKHAYEIDFALHAMDTQNTHPQRCVFVPNVVDAPRGMLVQCVVRTPQEFQPLDARALAIEYYKKNPLVQVIGPGAESPELKRANGSNRAFIHYSMAAQKRMVVVTVIDNLGKGMAGQAVQNMNLSFGFPKDLGVECLPISL